MLLPTDPEEANSVIGPISGGIAAGIVMLLAIPYLIASSVSLMFI
jgi:hypothetical protein